MSDEDYCELCDLPKSTCIHGRPPPPPAPPARVAPVKRTTRKSTTTAPARAVVRRWTPVDVFRPEIVAVLQEAGGELDADDLFLALETRMEERLTDADREKTPEGELRWRFAARRARQALVADGEMSRGRPGVWALTDGD
ncbi:MULTISPECIES: hypothetical protein [unclassified Nocardioides]|uniref:hypothetical protein n=1 Tax=unclassified Nocardioides TaxID=2615069 RepID=UPI0009EF8241|nr:MULTISPECIES: hypothetical protein [unclassified Nocardioides]GAW49864.1 uncharacterized protein PD653B2_2191 [Nocardioides sp. PD653-B2]GAW54620.1 uncharacterized protein PD653_2032 [Nocardioides sp. PD653]